ncbi:hypothetical protein ABTX81_26285 [Kitasatospora sp. NPDC097605]|uniref:hypothetical protein n=1 Tax=Kitasatospora sp. NPDC097605 TaxID=3157226 RepID=UPI003331D5C0
MRSTRTAQRAAAVTLAAAAIGLGATTSAQAVPIGETTITNGGCVVHTTVVNAQLTVRAAVGNDTCALVVSDSARTTWLTFPGSAGETTWWVLAVNPNDKVTGCLLSGSTGRQVCAPLT